MLNITDRKGKTNVEKLLFKPGSESKEVLENPFMELIYKEKEFNEEKANIYTAYYNNISNKYDLDVRRNIYKNKLILKIVLHLELSFI